MPPHVDVIVLTADELMLQAAEISRQASLALVQERQQNRQAQMASMMNRSAIPARYRGAVIMPQVKDQESAYLAGRAFVDDFDGRLADGAGLVLWGDVGTGKTHLACAIANELTKQLRPVLYCTALEAVQLVKASWKKSDDAMTEYDVYARFGEPDLLIIDEIGVQSRTDFENVVLTSIADIRSRNCKPTIIISNLAPEAIFELLGERMFDRLVGFGASVIHMPGRSLRMRSA